VTGASQEEAFERAVKFLSYRARSESEVRAKLAQLGFSRDTADGTVKKLVSLKLLNDGNFARAWTVSRVEGRGYGPLRIERELRQKGIAKSLIAQLLDETFSKQQGKERAKQLLEKRFRGKDFSDAKVFRRAVAFLQRRGYRDSVIAEILKRPLEDN
jgi:regulatory protein